jgi:hypothetical protein
MRSKYVEDDILFTEIAFHDAIDTFCNFSTYEMAKYVMPYAIVEFPALSIVMM